LRNFQLEGHITSEK